jgi:uncharacterized protein YlxW (UPF0749 family)
MSFKQKAISGASKVAMSPAVMKMLSNPQVQKAFLTMINANADFRDWIEGQVKSVAKGMSLVTTDDLGKIKRRLREANADIETLLDKIAGLEDDIAAVKKAAAKKPAARKPAARKPAAKKSTAKKGTKKK